MPGHIDRHPAVIVKVADAQDVIRVVALARELCGFVWAIARQVTPGPSTH